MGLLDALQNGGDPGGGILAWLQSLQQGQQPAPAGLPSDQAQYSPAQQAQPGAMPLGAQAPVFAQPTAPIAPPQAGAPMPAAGVPQQPPAVIPAALPPQGGAGAPAQPANPLGGLASFFNRMGDGLQSVAQGGTLQGAITGNYTDPKTQAAQVANVTARALIAKGVDPQVAMAAVAPGNAEMLKTLVAQNFGPQTVTSIGDGYVTDKNGKVTRAYTPEKTPLSIGNGYIYDPVTKKTIRAYEAEDKIPAGFAKGDDGNMHFIPGGPADPAYLRLAEAQKKDPNGNYVLGRGGEVVKNNPDGSVTVLHKNEAEAPVPMDPDSLEILARREIGGDFSGRKNLGRGAQGAADLKAITNKSSEILTKEMGMTPEQAAAHLLKKQQEYTAQGQGLNSEARTTGVREANLNLILKAADAAIPAALEASDKVSRTGFVPLNKIIQGGEIMTSDPDLKKFGMANLQLAEHWARAMNPTGVMRESDRDKALSFLSTADSAETYKAAVGQLRTQIERERDAVRATRGMSDLPGAGGTPSTPAAPLAPGQSSVINGVSIKRVN